MNSLCHFETMLLIRKVEDRLQQLCLEGEAGDLHFSKGQEAISVGICSALRPSDHIITHHRTIAHEIAKGADLYKLIAEVLGKRTGYNGGRAGEMHIKNLSINHDFSFQLVGTCVPVATGLAWALKNYKHNNEIVVVFFGDAASGNGQIHEGLSIASIHKVPLLVVVENNGLAGNIRQNHYMPTPKVLIRMAAYDISGRTIDGNCVSEVYNFAQSAVEHVRTNSEPFCLELDTTRLCWHKQGQRDIRSPEELAKLSERDPLIQEAGRLGISSQTRALIEDRIQKDLDEVFSRVARDPIAEMPC